MDQQFIDRIYECSFAPELWPGVLDELSQIADARGGHLTAFSTKILNWTSSESLRAGLERYYASDLVTRGQRIPRIIGARHAGFLREHDFFTDEELHADPLHQDFLRPAGLGWGAATAIPLPTGDTLFFGFERNQDRGFIESAIVQKLDAVRPHLARSAFMSARLQLERARVASETLALIGLPALVFDNQSKILAANHLIEALTDHIWWRAQGRMSLKDNIADALFRQAVETLNIKNVAPVRSFAVRSADANAAMVAHVIPIRRSAHDIFVRGAGVLVMTPVTLPQAPPVELVQSLFDLTPAEARVARSLSAGETVEKSASVGGVSLNTIRTQVRGVLEKTGCRRQSEVVALLGGITVVQG
jgi:DNA-binding CsgD family transcriptional regulator